jgi:hypothetical protein
VHPGCRASWIAKTGHAKPAPPWNQDRLARLQPAACPSMATERRKSGQTRAPRNSICDRPFRHCRDDRRLDRDPFRINAPSRPSRRTPNTASPRDRKVLHPVRRAHEDAREIAPPRKHYGKVVIGGVNDRRALSSSAAFTASLPRERSTKHLAGRATQKRVRDDAILTAARSVAAVLQEIGCLHRPTPKCGTRAIALTSFSVCSRGTALTVSALSCRITESRSQNATL